MASIQHNPEVAQPKRILLVDDDPLIIRMYQKKLSTDGYEVKTAANGAQALGQIVRERPDLVLLDVMMPEMNGVETLKALKADQRTADIPVIILTNLGDRGEDIENAKTLGALDYLVKSQTELADLTARVAQAIGEP
jgi:CheY-like chemotaxis protein